jgi:tRNA-Thr(GGU) m(6)t(6)A37 methyltransferase TsaA
MNFIGIIESPYKEKFSIPRQPNLIDLEMKIKMQPPYNRDEAFLGLNHFSHIWVIFQFHDVLPSEEKLSVRPPRLGGNTKQGVFATRSPYRPNRIGMSVVKLLEVNRHEIKISGGDFLHNTPVLDIKPYLQGIDNIHSDLNSWPAEIEDKKLEVEFHDGCEQVLTDYEKEKISQILALDPRPTYHEDAKKNYAAKLFSYDIQFEIKDGTVKITKIIS